MKIRFALLAALSPLVACTQTPPQQQPVDAGSPIALSMWRAKATNSLTAEDWRWFDVTLQELKLQVMLEGKTSGSAAIETVVRGKIDGRPFIEVMREGLQLHLQRKTAERDDTVNALATNEQKIKPRIKPGSDDILRDFNTHQDMLRQKLAKLEPEVAAAQTALPRYAASPAAEAR